MKFLITALFLLAAGVNPRPFNEPRGWEVNPYGPGMFQN